MDLSALVPERIVLNQEQWDAFMLMLARPPKANERLWALMESEPVLKFLAEHERRETLPRQACPHCQFEFSSEDVHVCC